MAWKWSRKANRPVEVSYGRASDLMPHCDARVLHAPGECEFCDLHPDWQEYRERSGINFTGHEEEGLAPCPSTYFRSLDNINRWPGNRPAPKDEETGR